MSDPAPFSAQADLVFFGSICRTISHEMNNVTAILLELVGLTQDRMAFANHNQSEFNQKTAQTLTRMETQLERAKHLMGLQNSFGHSIDDEHEFSVVDASTQALLLCKRWADLKKAELTLSCDLPSDFSFQGSRFLLLHILYRSFLCTLDSVDANCQIVLQVVASEEGFRFSIDSCAANTDGEHGQILRSLVHAVNGTLHDQSTVTLSFWLPRKLVVQDRPR